MCQQADGCSMNICLMSLPPKREKSLQIACSHMLTHKLGDVAEYLAGSVHAISWQETYVAGQGSQHYHLCSTSMFIDQTWHEP